MNCWWCHNPESRKSGIERPSHSQYPGKDELIGREVSVNEVMTELQKDRIFYDQSGGGVTFSGGEPLLQPEFLSALLNACHEAGLHTVVDTSGLADRSDFKRVAEIVDLFLYDLKLADDELHRENVGASNQLILDNLRYLVQNNKKVRVRVPLIPTITDTEQNLVTVADFIKSLDKQIPVDLLPFNLLARDKFQRFNLNNRLKSMATQASTKLEQMSQIFTERGIAVSIGG